MNLKPFDLEISELYSVWDWFKTHESAFVGWELSSKRAPIECCLVQLWPKENAVDPKTVARTLGGKWYRDAGSWRGKDTALGPDYTVVLHKVEPNFESEEVQL